MANTANHKQQCDLILLSRYLGWAEETKMLAILVGLKFAYSYRFNINVQALISGIIERINDCTRYIVLNYLVYPSYHLRDYYYHLVGFASHLSTLAMLCVLISFLSKSRIQTERQSYATF